MTTDGVILESIKTLDRAKEEMSDLIDDVDERNVQIEDTEEYLDEISRKIETIRSEQKIFYENIMLRFDEMIDCVK